MEPPDTARQSFIVRFWLERTPREPGGPLWRGSITHVPSGEKHYLADLHDLVAFIVPYLEGVEWPTGPGGQGRSKLARWARRMTRRDRGA